MVQSELLAKLPDRIKLKHPEIFALEPGVAMPPLSRQPGQAEAIGRLQLIQLVGLEIDKLVAEYKEVAEAIEEYERILGDEHYLMDIIVTDTNEIKEKYGDARRTTPSKEASAISIAKR